MPVINFLNKTVDNVKSGITNVKSKVTSAVSAVDPKVGRLLASGLGIQGDDDYQFENFNSKVDYNGTTEFEDWRVRISLAENSNIFYKDPNVSEIMQPLVETNGVVFPYTPRIDTSHTVEYQNVDIIHNNYPFYAYQKTSVNVININADFTAQTSEEARYVLAVTHFFRSAGKMFTSSDRYAGNPPPLLYLNGFGDHYFPNVPVVITQFSQTFPDDVDYISTKTVYGNELTSPVIGNCSLDVSGTQTRVPTLTSLILQLQPVYSRNKVSNFSLEKYSRGEYINGGYI